MESFVIFFAFFFSSHQMQFNERIKCQLIECCNSDSKFQFLDFCIGIIGIFVTIYWKILWEEWKIQWFAFSGVEGETLLLEFLSKLSKKKKKSILLVENALWHSFPWFIEAW